jgi:hypothetical protein
VGIVAAAAGPRVASIRASSELDAIGVRHGTALSSLGRDCLRDWERFLAPFRDRAFDLLEIGVGDGASLRTWREWFPAAQLVGLEARRIHLAPPIPGCAIVQGNQADSTTLHRVVKDRRFRVVIDDGSRRADDQILTFQTLFPWLEPGSVYVCAGLPDGIDGTDVPGQPGAGAWFAALGQMLATADREHGDGVAPPGAEAILPRVRGVFLMRGCALVTG